ncbi:MAG: amino acid ABC transporter substrate-binding protein, partial [Alphaproteobacteria bacterium]|nr:amino acid ABC transporter substrate-binding protein [Alphaproteobacteria bacterium]
MNKNLSVFALVVAVGALALGLFRAPANDMAAPKKETAYERVMRTRTLHCGYALWPTATEIDPNTNEMKGYVPAFANALGEKLGLKIEWVQEVFWGQQAEALNTGKIDAVCASDGPWVYTGAAFTDYVEPMVYIPVYLYGRAGETRFKTMDDVNAETVSLSTMDGDISLALADEKFPKAKRVGLPQSADPSLLATNVLEGKADLVLIDPPTADLINKAHETKLAKIFPEPLVVVNSSFSVGKGEQELLQMLNQGFRLLHQLGVSDVI